MMARQRFRYRIIYSTCSLPKEEEKNPKEKLFVFFNGGGERRKAYFQGDIAAILKGMGVKRITSRVIRAIEETAPKGSVAFRVKLVSKNDPYSIHPDHLKKWAGRVKERLEEKNEEVVKNDSCASGQ